MPQDALNSCTKTESASSLAGYLNATMTDLTAATTVIQTARTNGEATEFAMLTVTLRTANMTTVTARNALLVAHPHG